MNENSPSHPNSNSKNNNNNGDDEAAPAEIAHSNIELGGGLSEPFILRPVMTVLLTLSAIVLGIVAYKLLAVNDLPAIDYPVIQVSVNYPGANPTTMANNVATPLEKQFLQIPGLALVTSQSTQSTTSLTLQFDLEKSIDAAATDVQAAIQRATGELPTDLPSPPTFTKTNPNDQPVFYFALVTDTMTDGDLYKYGNSQVAQRISILPGVSEVSVYGVQGATRIKFDPSAIASRNMTVPELSAAIQSGTVYLGAGQFDGPSLTYILQPNGQLDAAEQYKRLIIGKGRDGSPIFLEDVAKVVESVQDERMSRSFWTRGFHTPGAVVVLAVSRQAGANVVQVAQSVKDLIPQIRQTLPGAITLIPVYDRSTSIIDSLNDVKETLFVAFLLVVAVIFVFLGRVKDTLIPSVALPLSLLLTFLVMYLLNYSINNLTLLAMTLAIGFLVDDAIVFLENVVRLSEAGETTLQAVFHSAREISFTILSMTLSLAAVFIPLVLMPGLLGRIFREFAITIIVAIIASGVVSLTLTPLMCSRLLGRRGKAETQKTWMERKVGRFMARVIHIYGKALDWFLDRSWLTIPIFIVCIIGLFFFFSRLPFTLLPTGDSGFVQGIFLTKEGTSPEQIRGIQKQVDDVLHNNPSVQIAFTLASFSARIPSNQAIIFTILKPVGQRPPIETVVGQLTHDLSKIPGVIPFLRANPVLQISLGATNQNQGRYAYVLSGINPIEVQTAAAKLLAAMNNFPGFIKPVTSDFFNNTPNLGIDILRDQGATYGLTASAVETTIRDAYSQNYIYLIKRTDDQYQVILEALGKDRAFPDDLRELYLRSTTNQGLVPMRAVTNWKTVIGRQSVNHFDQFPSITINFNLPPSFPEGDAIKFIQEQSAKILSATPTVQGIFQGEASVLRDLVNAFPILFAAAIFVMYVILGILYESYVHPLTVLSTLPPAIIGGLFTMWIFGAPLSLYSIIGLFMLIGIVKKNGIMIVDFALQRLDEGYDRRTAIHEASMERFRPIIMTTLAALMGAVPLALGFGSGGGSRQPLGFVIVGGLLFSQLITLFITPVIYLWFETFQEQVLDRVPFLRSTHTHAKIEAAEAAENAT